jgi:hypothetical protein
VRVAAYLAALAAVISAGAAQAEALVRFVACPVYRDTDAGKKSGCWLATDPASGTRWDVSLAPYKPDWNHAVLVEGRAAKASAEACGAPVLDPVRTSILDETCPHHMLPAEGYPGRRFALPPRTIQPLSVERPVPAGPYAERTFPVMFEWDRSFLIYQYDDYLVDQAVTWIRAARPRALIVTGFAATEAETVSGHVLAERPEVARERADAVALTLSRLLPGLPITTRTETAARTVDVPEADTIPGQSQRRAEIRAIF